MVTPVKSNQQFVFIHDALCEGPIQGLLYGDASVYLNGNRARDIDPDAPFSPINGTITFNGTTGTISGISIPPEMVGAPLNENYLAIRNTGILKSSTTGYSSTTGQITINGDSNFTSTYTTLDDASKFIVLSDPDTNEVFLTGDGEVDGTNLKFYPSANTYNQNYYYLNTYNYKVQLLELVQISSITTTTIITTSAPSLGNISYNFIVSGSDTPSPEDINADNPVKVSGFNAQFRNGSLYQSPIAELNGVGSGTSYAGNPQQLSSPLLKQLNVSTWNTANPSDTILGGGSGYSTSGYPSSQTGDDFASSPTEIPSSFFSGGSTSVVPTLDEVRIGIQYNQFMAINKSNGDEYSNNAVYLFQIARKAPGQTSFGPWQNAFKNLQGVSVGQIFHNAKEKSSFNMEHFIDLEFIKPFIDFKIRVTRLTRHKGTAVGSRGEDQDSDHDQGDSTSTIATLIGINKDKFSYPHTSHVGVFLDSKEFGSVPKRSYEVRGLKVKIPKGYTPREYTTDNVAIYPQFWDGSFETSLFYTDNPAWVFYDIVTNNRFGAGDWVNPDDIDKYSLYRIARYCDELVDDGKEGTEPRFRANVYLSKATDVYKVLKDMATIFGSMLYWLDGRLTPVLDAPSDPVYSFSKSNVIDGAFTYESTGQKTRSNQVIVTWNNPEAGYEQQALIVEDRVNIARTGRIIKEDAFAFGCTSEGQARRYGKWKLFTAQNQSEIVSFQTSFEGLFLKPGDIIQVQDSARYGATLSGRIVTQGTDSNSLPIVTLDRPVTLNSSSTYSYELSLIMTQSAAFYAGEVDSTSKIYNSNGSVLQTITTRGERVPQGWVDTNEDDDAIDTTRTLRNLDTEERASNAWSRESGGELLSLTWKKDSFVETVSVDKANSGNTSTSGNMIISCSDNFTATANDKSIWMLKEAISGASSVVSPDLYRVLGIAKDSNNTYTISGVEHHPEKYDFIDDPDAILDIPDDLFPDESPVFQAPTNLFILQNSNASKPNEELVLAWDFPDNENSKYLDSFEIVHNLADEEEVITVAKGRRRYAFNEVPNGEYIFRVRAISVRENKSAWISARYVVDDPFSDNVNRDKGLQLEGLASQFPFVTNESDSSNGQFRGTFDSTKGQYSSVSNPEGYRVGDIVLYSNSYYYLPISGTASNISTWDNNYRGGILKFRHDVSPILAPSRFRRSDAVSLSSSFTFDVNIIRSEDDKWLGVTGSNNVRVAYVVLDHSTSSLKLIHAKFDEALNFFYWYDLKEAMDSSNTTEEAKYWTALTGTIQVAAGSNKVIGTNTNFSSLSNLNKLRLSSTFGARVSYIENDTTMYLDRRVTSTISSGTTAYVQKYAPDFRKDVIIGRVSVPNNGRGDFTFENFLTLDPNLEGNRSVIIDSNVAFLQFDADEDLTLAPDRLDVTATSIGFDEPLFKITYGDPSTAPLDSSNNPTIFSVPSTSFQQANEGLYGFKFNVWDGTTTIPYDGGAAYTITVEIIEREDQGNSDKTVSDSITIAKVGDVASASGGRSVFMELEDYSIIYNDGGAKPIYNGQPDYALYPSGTANILFSATASPGFGSPIFRWKVDGTAIVPDSVNYPNATWYEASGGGDLATYDWPVPATLGDATNGFSWTNRTGGSKSVVVEVAEKPTAWTATVPGSGTNTNEVTAADIFAKDVDNLLAIRLNEGGLGINFVNDSHIIPCDATGLVLSSANSGGSIEVFLGGQGVDYVASNPGPGEFTLGNISTTEDAVNGVGITVGGRVLTTQTNGPDIVTIQDHTFNGTLDTTGSAGFEIQESITYPLTIMPFDGSVAIQTSVTQVFTLVQNGAQSATGLVYLYSTGTTSSDLTAIDSSFKPVIVTMATGAVQHTAPTGFSGAVFQDGEYGYYTTATAATTNATAGEDLWVVAATANSIADTYDAILYDEWTAPIQFSGTDGFNSATIEIFASNSTESSSPTLPGDTTYTFSPPGLSGTITPWSTTVPAPSRSNPYVWRSSAAAVSNTATATIDGVDSGANSDGEDWSTPVLINRFVEDGITLELTNDTETVGADEGSAVTVSVTTTAKVFQGGADVSNQWDFEASLPTNLTCNTATSATDPVSGTGNNFNVFEVTRLETAYTNGNIQITATAKSGGTYDGAAARSTNFTVSRINNGEQGVSYRIVPSTTAVSYSPLTTTYAPSGAVTFEAYKIDPDGTSSLQTGYWAESGGGSNTIDNTSASSSITVTPTGTSNITVSFYLSYTSNTLGSLVDRETVPVVSDGSSGSSVDVWFARTPNTPTVTSISSSGVPTGSVTWSTTISGTSGTNQLWAVVIKKAINATTYTNDTPYKVNGTSAAEVYCYRKTTGGTSISTAPADTAYNFVNTSFTVDTSVTPPWQQSIPAITTNQDRIYVSYAIATGTPETTNALLEWSAPVLYAIREDGINTATITLYVSDSQAITAPARPNTSNTWNFDNGNFTGTVSLGNGAGKTWSLSPPALSSSNKYLWTCTQTVSGTGATATVGASSSWSGGEVIGNFANDAYNQNTITLYKRNNGNSAPARPTNTSVWKFSTASFTTAPNNSWSLTAPTLNSTNDTLWSCSQIASSQTDTDSLPGGNEASNGWSAQTVVGRFGTDGTKGDQGTQGAQGTQGTQGAQGTQGTQGAQGTRGLTGDDGPTGAAFFRVTSGNTGVAASQITTTRINSAIGRTFAVLGDVCVVIASNSSQSAGYRYNAAGGPGNPGYSTGNWVAAGTFITGDLVVDGTIGADQIAADSISARELTISTYDPTNNSTNAIHFDSSTTNGPSIKIYDTGLRVKLGKL